jgi:hypothetical protein
MGQDSRPHFFMVVEFKSYLNLRSFDPHVTSMQLNHHSGFQPYPAMDAVIFLYIAISVSEIRFHELATSSCQGAVVSRPFR